MLGWQVATPPPDPLSESTLMGPETIPNKVAQQMLDPPLYPPSKFPSRAG